MNCIYASVSGWVGLELPFTTEEGNVLFKSDLLAFKRRGVVIVSTSEYVPSGFSNGAKKRDVLLSKFLI